MISSPLRIGSVELSGKIAEISFFPLSQVGLALCDRESNINEILRPTTVEQTANPLGRSLFWFEGGQCPPYQNSLLLMINGFMIVFQVSF